MAPPDRSSATRVFSKVGGAGSFAIFSTSASCSAMAASSAGSNSETCTLSNGGTPPWGPVHGASRGFCTVASEGAAGAGGAASSAKRPAPRAQDRIMAGLPSIDAGPEQRRRPRFPFYRGMFTALVTTGRTSMRIAAALVVALAVSAEGGSTVAPAPDPTASGLLLVANKGDHTLGIIDPVAGK